MPTPGLCDALEHHREEVVKVLRHVRSGCRNGTACEASGICQIEIEESACAAAGSEPTPPAREDGAANDEVPPEAVLGVTGACTGSGLPGSRNDRPSPSCGSAGEDEAVRSVATLAGPVVEVR